MNKKTENKTCQNCKLDFVVESEDFNFYEKIKVPPPTWCSECRQQRRYAYRNERTLYRRDCDLCKKSIVTIYSQNKPCTVYCLPCWWSDNWDFASYGRDFDFSRPFFEQFSELQNEVPRMALLNKNSVNSEYTNHSGDNRNVYLSFSCFGSEDIFYSTWAMKSRSCVDCSYIYEGGEKLYECMDSRKSYKCQYSLFLQDCTDCYYCYDLRGCSDCFLSSNLRNKSYVFMNEQYTREAYLEKIKEYNLSSFEDRERLNQEFIKILKNQSIHKAVVGERNVDSLGNMIYNCKNAKHVFDGEDFEDSKYIYSALGIKTCMDLYHVGINTEMCYEMHGCTRVYDSQFCHLSYDDTNIMYCDSCQNSQNLFGCMSVKKGEYMIFNKKYPKDEYLKLKEKIIEHMKKTGEYGEFFPPQNSPVSYNETQGNFYKPMNKDEVLNKGWLWEDRVPGTFNKETIKSEEIPDSIDSIDESFLKHIYRCLDCTKNYNMTSDELIFYKNEKIPIPRRCPDCRYKRRFDLRLPRNLWHRQCMCTKQNHEHKGVCSNEFETSYSPDRSEIIYCESCYQKEVI